MKPRSFLALFVPLILFSALSSAAFAEAKAYDLIQYAGKVGGIAIAFDYADGYIQASEVRVTEGGKTTRFRLDDSGEMHFVPEKRAGSDNKLILKLGIDDAPPAKIEGSYISGGKMTAFVMVRK